MIDADRAPNSQVKKTWKPIAAGIVDITVGCLCLIGAIGIFLMGVASSLILGLLAAIFGGYADAYLCFVGPASVIAVPLLVFGILAIIGGICAMMRKWWTFALFGSIAGVLLAIVYILWMGFSIPWDTRFEFFVFVVILSIVFLPTWLLSIIAIVLAVQSKNEFE